MEAKLRKLAKKVDTVQKSLNNTSNVGFLIPLGKLVENYLLQIYVLLSYSLDELDSFSYKKECSLGSFVLGFSTGDIILCSFVGQFNDCQLKVFF